MSLPRSLSWIVLLLLVAWGLLTIRIGASWVGHQDANGAWISSAIHNYERYGFGSLGGMIVLNHSPAQPSTFHYYTNHPPIAVWLPAIPVLLVGYDEAIVRFVFAACTLLGIAVLYALARRLFGQIRGLWSAAFYVFMPMTIYFGRMPDHEAPALLLLLLFAWRMAVWLQKPTPMQWLILAVLMLAQAWTAWGGLICTLMVCAAGLWAGKRSQRPALLGIIGVGLAGALLVVAFYQLQWTGTLEDFVTSFAWRTSSQSFKEGSEPFTLGQYALRMLMRFVTLFTPTICIIAVFGMVSMRRAPSTLHRAVPAALLLGGLAFVLLFRNASYIHDYYLIYLTPSVAMLAAAGLWYGWNQRKHRRWLRPLLVGMLIFTPLASWRYTSALYQGSEQTDPLMIAQAIQQQTDTDALIMSNLPTVGPAIEFYASRDIHWNISPVEATARSEERHGVFYFHCGESGSLPPNVSPMTEVEVISGCRLSQLS